MTMLAVYVLGLHMLGEFVAETGYMRQYRLADWQPRFFHGMVYCLCFWPLWAFQGWPSWFLPVLMMGHFAAHSLCKLLPAWLGANKILAIRETALVLFLALLCSAAEWWRG